MNQKALRLILFAISITAALSIMGCGKGSFKSGSKINGAGATFPAPVYATWADQYNQINGVQVNYNAIGSGGGVQQIKAKTVDFGASDAPLTADELKAADLMQFPMIMGGVVPVVNIAGIKPGQLQLTAQAISDIYLGKIKKWNDPAIVKSNPGLTLPATNITVVARADGSGTSWIFTNYLDKVSKEWHSKVGFGKTVNWPAAGTTRGKGNDGVAAFVKRIDGAIGYVEYAYALQGKLTHVKLQNKSGKFVEPSIETFQGAAAGADWKNAPGFYVALTDQPGDKSWPVTGASYIIVQKKMTDEKTATAMLKFFDWSYRHGRDMAKELDYVPMPENVITLVTEKWKTELTINGKPAWK